MDFIYIKAAEEALALDLKKDKALIINLAYMVILALTLVYDMMAKEGVHTFRIALAAVTAWIMFFVYKKTFLRRSRISFYLIFTFVFAAMYLGSVLDFYIIIPGYDKILHLISGVIIAYIGYIFYLNLVKTDDKEAVNPMMGVVFSIIFSIAAAGAWEIWEFSTDQLFGFTSQNNSLIDTMMDIICGTVMGILANIPIAMYIKGKKVKFIEKLVEDMRR